MEKRQTRNRDNGSMCRLNVLVLPRVQDNRQNGLNLWVAPKARGCFSLFYITVNTNKTRGLHWPKSDVMKKRISPQECNLHFNLMMEGKPVKMTLN